MLSKEEARICELAIAIINAEDIILQGDDNLAANAELVRDEAKEEFDRLWEELPDYNSFQQELKNLQKQP